MRHSHSEALQKFRRVRAFLTAEAPAVKHGSTNLHETALGEVIERLSANGVALDATMRRSKALTVRKARLVRDLRDAYMRPASEMTRMLFPNDDELTRALPQGARGPERGVAGSDAARGRWSGADA